MIEQLAVYAIPWALALLPPAMTSRAATAMLLAIALQESRGEHRRQLQGGPARGLWQFELAGVEAVLTHRASQRPIAQVLDALRYRHASTLDYHRALEHNDVLAASFARCLLWTLPQRLPTRDQADKGWRLYLAAWRPGKPHAETWPPFWAVAWDFVEAPR